MSKFDYLKVTNEGQRVQYPFTAKVLHSDRPTFVRVKTWGVIRGAETYRIQIFLSNQEKVDEKLTGKRRRAKAQQSNKTFAKTKI